MKKHNNVYLTRLGNSIRKKRAKIGLTQEGLAFNCELDRSYIGGIERGERNISIITLAKLAHNLNCSISDLTRGIEDERKR